MTMYHDHAWVSYSVSVCYEYFGENWQYSLYVYQYILATWYKAGSGLYPDENIWSGILPHPKSRLFQGCILYQYGNLTGSGHEFNFTAPGPRQHHLDVEGNPPLKPHHFMDNWLISSFKFAIKIFFSAENYFTDFIFIAEIMINLANDNRLYIFLLVFIV